MLEKEKPQPLVDWSKWLIGINFAAATGCAIVLKNANPEPNLNGVSIFGVSLFLAICFFCLSIICSVILIFRIGTDDPEDRKLAQLHRTIALFQMASFILALISFCVWVGAKTWK